MSVGAAAGAKNCGEVSLSFAAHLAERTSLWHVAGYHRPRLVLQVAVAGRPIELPPANRKEAPSWNGCHSHFGANAVADAIDCQREMQLLRLGTAATIKATRQTITESHILLAAADTLLTRMP